MGSSNASRNGHGGSPTSGTHTRRTFDEGEDSIFALSLDDVMDDRPWTANELMSGKTPSAGDPSETASFIAAAQHNAPEPPVADLDDFATRQFAFDSWAAADLDETSAGMPALDIPVNPLFAAAEERDSAYDNTAAYVNRPSEQPRAGRIETEDYGQTSSSYSRDPFAATPAPDYNQASVKAASASSYTRGTDDERFADYYTEEEPPRFSEFSQAAKVVFIAIIIALLGVIAFEGFQLFRSPVETQSATQQKENESKDYLDVNNLKGDPNDGDE